MAEAVVNSASYLLKKRALELEMELEIKAIENFEHTKMELQENYEGLIKDAKRRMKKDKTVCVNPLIYLREWATETGGSQATFIREMMRKYKGDGFHNVNFILEDFIRIAKERDAERLVHLKDNIYSMEESVRSKYETRAKELDELCQKAKEVATNYGVELKFTQNGVRISANGLGENFPFFEYLERLVNHGLRVRDWRFEDDAHRAVIEAEHANLMLEHGNTSTSIYIPANSDGNQKCIETVDMFLEDMKKLQRDPSEEEKIPLKERIFKFLKRKVQKDLVL